jgi:uncharacterized protein with PIN domain
MAVVEIALTAEPLAAAVGQLSHEERRSFLGAVLSDATNQQVALEFIRSAQAVLKRKRSPAKQRLLDRLLTKNSEGKLRAAERKQLEQLMTEYGEGLIEKARAVHVGTGSAYYP